MMDVLDRAALRRRRLVRIRRPGEIGLLGSPIRGDVVQRTGPVDV